MSKYSAKYRFINDLFLFYKFLTTKRVSIKSKFLIQFVMIMTISKIYVNSDVYLSLHTLIYFVPFALCVF